MAKAGIATSMNPDQASEEPVARDLGIDALRAATTFLVVLHHTALTYGAIGSWYYRELQPDGSLQSLLLTFFCAVNQAWFMGLFFLLAGYFTPPGVDRHGVIGFVRERLLRLGVPLLVYAVFIGPFTVALAQTARGRDFSAVFLGQWQSLRLEPGPLWFVEALLIFTAVYLGVRSFVPSSRPDIKPTSRLLLAAALLTGASAFLLRLYYPVGMTVSALQLGYFASYVVLFAAGCMCAHGRWLSDVPSGLTKLWRRVTWLVLPILPVVVLAGSRLQLPIGRTDGGWSVGALAYAFWEPFVAWGIILSLLHGFRSRLASPTELWRNLSRSAYLIFIIHPPIVVAVALAWRGAPLPAVVKFLLTGAMACVLCYGSARLLLRISFVRRVA